MSSFDEVYEEIVNRRQKEKTTNKKTTPTDSKFDEWYAKIYSPDNAATETTALSTPAQTTVDFIGPKKNVQGENNPTETKQISVADRIKQIDEELAVLNEQHKTQNMFESMFEFAKDKFSSLVNPQYQKVNASEEDIKRKRDALITEKVALQAQELAKDNKAAGVALNLVSNLGKGIGAIETVGQGISNKINDIRNSEDNLVNNLTSGLVKRATEKFSAEENKPVNTNSAFYIPANIENATREGLLDGTSGIGRFVAETGLSVAQVVSTLPFTPAGSLAIMSTGAAAQTAKDVIDRGGTTEQAMLQGAISGLVEFATEKIPLDNLYKIAEKAGKAGVKQVVGDILKQSGMESLEEATSEAVNTIADWFIMKDKSEYEVYKKEHGFDAARKKFLDNVILAATGGALSGGVLGAGGTAVGQLKTAKEANNADSQSQNDNPLLAKFVDTVAPTAENTSRQTNNPTDNTAIPLTPAHIIPSEPIASAQTMQVEQQSLPTSPPIIDNNNDSESQKAFKYEIKEDVDISDDSSIFTVTIYNLFENYREVMDEIKEIGGSYSKEKHGFIFQDNPDEKLRALVDKYTVIPAQREIEQQPLPLNRPTTPIENTVVTSKAQTMDSNAEKVAKAYGLNAIVDNTLSNTNINGYYSNGTIYINPNAANPQMSIVTHELTHSLESSGNAYEQLKQYVIDSPVTQRYVADGNITLDEYKSELADMYLRNGVQLDEDGVERELVADFAGRYLFSDQKQIDRLANTNPTLFQKIMYWIRDMAVKLKGSADEKFLREAEKLYIKAAREFNIDGNSQAESSVTATESYSIRENGQGEKYVLVDTDQHLFDGADVKDYPKIAKKYILDKFRGNVIGGKDNRAFVNRTTAEEYTHPAAFRGMDKDIKSSKMKAATELDNLLSVGTFVEHLNDDGRHEKATGGWDNYKTTFELGGKIFEGIIKIMNTPNGRLLYDLTQIKDISAGPAGQTGNVSPAPPSTFGNIKNSNSHNADTSSAATNIISQEPQNVNDNTQFSLSENPVNANRELIRNIQSKYGIKRLNKSELDTFNTMIKMAVEENNINNPEIRTELINMLIENGTGDNPLYNAELADVQKDIRRYTIYGSPEMKAEISNMYGGELAKFNQEMFANKLKVTGDQSKNPTPIDTVYNELQEIYGEATFPRLNHEGEQIMRMLELLQGNPKTISMGESIALQAQELGTTEETLIQELDWELQKEFIKYGAKAGTEAEWRRRVNEIREQLKKDTSTAKKEARKQYQGKINELHENFEVGVKEKRYEDRWFEAERNVKKDQEIFDLKQNFKKEHEDSKYKDFWKEKIHQQEKQTMKDRAKRRVIDDKIMKVMNELDDMQKKASPADREMINKLISSFDLEAKGGLSKQSRLNVENWIKYFNKNSENTIGTPEAGIPKTILEKIERLDKKNIKDLSVREADDLLATAKFLKQQVQKNHVLFEENKAIDAYKKAETAIDEMKSSRKTNLDDGKYIRYFSMNPKTFFKKLSNGDKNGVFYKWGYEALNKGQLDMYRFQRDAMKPAEEYIEGHRKTFESWTGKDAKFIDTGIVNSDGKHMKITPAMQMTLYLAAKRKNYLNHIEKGGVTVPDEKTYSKGEITKAYANGTRFVLDKEAIKQITDGMTKEQKYFADKIAYDYFNRVSKNAINEKTMLLDGYEKAREDNYIPILSDENYVNRDFSGLIKDGTLEGSGFLKETTGSGNPVVLEDITQLMYDHIQAVSKFCGYAVPIRNLNTLMNVSTVGYGKSVIKAVNDKYGMAANLYIKDLMDKLQSQKSGDRSLLEKGTSKYAQAVLSGNIGSALQQPTAIFNAMPELGLHILNPANIAKPVKNSVMEKNSELFWYRTRGNNSPEMTAVTEKQTWDKKVPFLMNWLEKSDEWGMKRIWNGAENWVKVNNKTLRPNSAEFYKKVGEKFDEVLLNTQSNSTMMQKAKIMRSDNALTKSATLFQNQFYTVYNQLIDAGQDVEYSFRTGKGKTEAAQKMSLAVAGGILSAVTAALAVGLRDLIYGREPEDIVKATTANIVGYIPFGSIAFGVADSFLTESGWDKDFNGLQVSNVNTINTLIDDILALAEAKEKVTGYNLRENKKQLAAPAKKVALDVSKLFGVPAANFEKLITGFVGSAFDLMVLGEVLPESFAGAREGYQNYFEDFDGSDLNYAAKNRNSFAFKSMFSMVLDNTLNKGDLFNTNKFDTETKKEIFRLYEQNNAIGVVPNPDRQSLGDNFPLTFSQQIDYGKEYARIVQPNVKNLLNSKMYGSFSDEDRIRAIEYMYTYAGSIAGISIEKEYTPAKWITNLESVSSIVPVYAAIAWRAEFNKKGKDGKNLYSNEDKRRLLLEDESLTATQKQEIDKIFINDVTIIPKDTFADYTSIDDFELSLLSDAKQNNYDKFELENEISKSKYSFAVNAVSNAEIKSIKDKDGKTISNSEGLLMRELIDGLETLTASEKKAIYEAVGVNKTVAAMDATTFNSELAKVKKYMD